MQSSARERDLGHEVLGVCPLHCWQLHALGGGRHLREELVLSAEVFRAHSIEYSLHVMLGVLHILHADLQ